MVASYVPLCEIVYVCALLFRAYASLVMVLCLSQKDMLYSPHYGHREATGRTWEKR